MINQPYSPQEPQGPELTEITPAQDFPASSGQALFTVPFMEFTSKRPRKILYTITSDREKILFNEEELMKRGYYYDRHPDPPIRWSESSINEYLKRGKEVSPEQVFCSLRAILIEHLDLGDERWYDFIACWIIGTYLHRMFYTYPYIHLNGGMESGKSKTLTVIAAVAFNAESTFNATPSFISRCIHHNHSTCCIDETERLSRGKDEATQAVIGMFNCGYKKGQFAGKSEPHGSNQKWISIRQEGYSPKAFAGINNLEPSLASRCVPINTMRTTNIQIRNREIDLFDPRFQRIRDGLYIMTLCYYVGFQGIYQGIDDDEITGRDWELSKPILTIATLCGSGVRDRLRSLALEVQGRKKDEFLESTIIPKLLTAITFFLNTKPDGNNFYPTPELVQYLINEDPEGFGWLGDHKSPGRWLGMQLRQAGVVDGPSRQQKHNGSNTRGFILNKEIVIHKLEAYR